MLSHVDPKVLPLLLGSEGLLIHAGAATGMYASVQQLIDRLGTARAAQLTAESGSTPDGDLLLTIIDEAEGEVNSYLARRFAVPVDLGAHPELAGMLRSRTLDVAVFRTMARRPPVPEPIKAMYDSAVKALREMAAGDSNLPAATTPASQQSDRPLASYGGSANDISRENML